MLGTVVRETCQYFSVATEVARETAFGVDAYELVSGKRYAGYLYDGAIVDGPGGEPTVYFSRLDWRVFSSGELKSLDIPSLTLRCWPRSQAR